MTNGCIQCVVVSQADVANGSISLRFNGLIFMYGMAQSYTNGCFAESGDLIGRVFMELIKKLTLYFTYLNSLSKFSLRKTVNLFHIYTLYLSDSKKKGREMIKCSDHSLSSTLPVLAWQLWSQSLVSHLNDIFFPFFFFLQSLFSTFRVCSLL